MILSCSNITKSFGDNDILKHISFHIEEHEKAAVVGINGAGKSTLLKIMIGELAPDEGSVTVSKGSTIGYLAQHQDLEGAETIYDALLEVKRPILEMEEQLRRLELEMKSASGDELEAKLAQYGRLNHEFEMANGYACRSEITGVLKGLGFEEDEFAKPITALSGGQKTRVSLGKLLLTKPDILLLDEPTNHLDMESIAWLETYLKSYTGAVLIVAHDRYFLDRVVTKIVELDNGVGTVFLGNYSAYSDKKAMLRDAQIRAYLNQQQEIKHQEAVITKLKSFNREKSIRRAESREKMLEKIERIDKPVEVNDSMDIRLEPDVVSGNDVLTVKDLRKSFGSQLLFEHVDFEVKRGERIAIIGNNGTGKTTLLKIINRMLPADTGEIRLGSKVHIGYYDQEHQVLHMEKTLFDEIQDTYPTMNNTQIRNTLASFLFTGDDVFKLIRDLSGGERGRVSLAKLMLSDANFLLLDEPTNHLDITSKEILESALNRYTGTVLYVSHDRYFINRTATRILDLTGRSFVNYIGNYDYYLEKKEDVEAAHFQRLATVLPGSAPSSVLIPGGKAAAAIFAPEAGPALSEKESSAAPAGKLEWKAQKEEQARIRKLQNDLKKTEDEIHRLETRDAEIDGLLALEEVYTDVTRLMELNKEKEEGAARLEELYARWEELAEEV
ncbi:MULTISPECIES: ribosomal protection-like ABC-F family protein [Enterocloster]|uniref:ATP-binding cassette, subfamily F, member 3 n=3 Tax=Enterocloster TaxID=2719313 RepID=A0A1I0C273_9FIRM|nr:MULTISPECIES: ABC-F family ATP-binding cassette domain-containing protein [Enterocloster]MDR3758714.1 ABC-F family ATP-binding cassette domain-containing protein [Enterocloster sp.]SET13578.1 ATP-binding cassette, subfamily F, member 3 [Enterocloster lavalensis]